MIGRVEAHNFRCLRYVKQDLDPFQVLVGPNASGKTTFFDAVRFLGQLVAEGLDAAVRERSEDIRDLFWRREGERFELAVELVIPPRQRSLLKDAYARCRYEVAVGIDATTQENSILAEQVLLMPPEQRRPVQERLRFPEEPVGVDTILTQRRSKTARWKVVIKKVPGGNDCFYDERGRGWTPTFKLGSRKSALGNLPEDESKFPVVMWLKGMLQEGMQNLVLNSAMMRRPSPPGRPRVFRTDGSNLPWVVEDLRRKAPERLAEWVAHLRTALPDLEDVETRLRDEDRHRYLVVRYKDGLTVPSWMISDGTLRLLALTLLAYLPDLEGSYLIEEPENGIHPRAVETVFQSLSSVYDAQVLLATHSPVILGLARPEQVLCCARTPQGATDIVDGSRHPALKEWRGETNLGTLYAAGVLG